MIIGYFDKNDEEEDEDNDGSVTNTFKGDDDDDDDDDDGCVPNTFKRRSPAARGKARGRFAPGLTCPSAPPIKRFLSRYF